MLLSFVMFLKQMWSGRGEINKMNEEELEKLCLDWFRNNNWDIAYGPDIAPDSSNPERSDYHQVVLKRYLHEALIRINPHLPESAIDQAIARVLKPDSLDLNTSCLLY